MKLEPSLPKGDNGFLYVESKRARLEREKVSVLFLLTKRVFHPCFPGGEKEKV